MSYREWAEQIKLRHLLNLWLDQRNSFWTAIDTACHSQLAGAMRKKRGVAAGLSDCLVWHRGRTYCIELKSPYGQIRPAQRDTYERMLAAGVRRWFFCRTAESALVALAKSGVRLAVVDGIDGTAYWRRFKLEPWEEPKTHWKQKRPRPPTYWAPKLPVALASASTVATDATAPAAIAA
jgi:hypothetical protein